MGRPPSPWKRKGAGGAWYGTVNGVQVRLADATAAKSHARSILYDLLSREHGRIEPRSDLTVRELAEEYMHDCEQRVERNDLAASTLESYEIILRSAVNAFGKVAVADLTEPMIDRWLTGRGWKRSRQRGAFTVLHQTIRWGIKSRLVGADPMARLKPPPAARHEFDATADVRADLLRACDSDEFRAFVEGLIETGCRPGELAGATAADVSLAAGTLRVKNKTRRRTGAEFRTIYLSPRAVELFGEMTAEHPDGPLFRTPRGRPWNRHAWGKRFRRIRGRIGAAEMVAYSMRHAYATDGIAAAVNPVILAELMGHTSVDMIVKVYSKVARRRGTLAEAAAQVRPAPAPTAAPTAPAADARTSPPPETGPNTPADSPRSGRRRSGSADRRGRRGSSGDDRP